MIIVALILAGLPKQVLISLAIGCARFALPFVLKLHALADAARVSFAPLRYDDDLRSPAGIRVLALAPVVFAHELLVLLIILLLLISLAHYRVFLLEGVVVAALELSCIIVSAVKTVVELALVARHLLVTVTAPH